MTDALRTAATSRPVATTPRPPTTRPRPPLGGRINARNRNHPRISSRPSGAAKLAIRTDARNPNHHLWNNNGTWFVHYTVHPDHLTAARIRKSLKTQNLDVARRRRDRIFRAWHGERLE